MILIALASGMLYRLGGKAGWNTKARDVGCAVLLVLALIVAGVQASWWMFLIVGVLTFASLTSYWSIINKTLCAIRRKTSGEYPCEKCPMTLLGTCDIKSEKWWNWYAHGFGMALAALPLCFTGSVSWTGFAARLVLLPLLVMFWSLAYDSVEIEETGRGVLLIISLAVCV